MRALQLTVLDFRTKQARSLRAYDVQGNIDGIVYIEIRKDAKLVGDVRTARIIEDGAYFNGCLVARARAAAKNVLSIFNNLLCAVYHYLAGEIEPTCFLALLAAPQVRAHTLRARDR